MTSISRALLPIDSHTVDLTEKSVEFFEQLKKNQTWKRLRLKKFRLEEIDKLEDAIKHNNTLQRLDLHCNRLDNAASKVLRRAVVHHETLTDLNLSQCNLSDATELASLVRHNKTLIKLNLGFNQFGKFGGYSLGVALKENSTLRELSLNCCGLIDISEFAESLTSNRSLVILDLALNKFDDKGGEALAQALEKNADSVLAKLDITHCGVSDTLDKRIKTFVSRQLKPAKDRKAETDTKLASSFLPLEKFVKPADNISTTEDIHATELTKVIRFFRDNYDIFKEIIEDKLTAKTEEMRVDYIHSQANLFFYYQYFVRHLIGSYLACLVVYSKVVDHAKNEILDHLIGVIPKIGEMAAPLVPFPSAPLCIPAGAKLVEGCLNFYKDRQRKIEVQRIALLFCDFSTGIKELEQLARQLTISREGEISRMPSPQGFERFKEWAKDSKSYITGSDADTPLKRRAIEDCEKLLKAMREGKFSSKSTTEDALCIIRSN